MEVGHVLVPLFAIALCVWAAIQFVGWVPSRLSLLSPGQQSKSGITDRRREALNGAEQTGSARAMDFRWLGYRRFKVAALNEEADGCRSVVLAAADGKPIARFQPGQHLTLRIQPESECKPLVRCYSLSHAFHPEYYRITVKTVPAPSARPDTPPGRASTYINTQLTVGQIVDVKAPSGNFFLDDSTDDPVVLLAGGIGITPMMSMIESVVAQHSNRGVLLFYGSVNSRQHIFRNILKAIDRNHENISIINCYSAPLPEDRAQHDFQVHGRVTGNLIRSVLPHSQFQFYLCGPPPFMESIYRDLVDWGVHDSRLHFESFGPASIKRMSIPAGGTLSQSEMKTTYQIKFTESSSTVNWSTVQDHSLLEVAEAHHVPMSSGCRAGSCGTCETTLLNGNVKYPDHLTVQYGPGKCLPCVARPTSDVELEA